MSEIQDTDADGLKETINPNGSDILKAQDGMGTLKEIIGAAKAAESAATESQRMIATLLTDAQTKLNDIAAIATQVVAAKTKVADDQSVIATKSDHIQNAQAHADSVRASLDRILTAVTQQATEIEGQKTRTQSASDSATELLTSIRTMKGMVEIDTESVVSAKKTAEEAASSTTGLADKAKTIEARVTGYEKRLAELEVQCADRLKTIDDLLPGATSAGLAHAFNERRETFLRPQRKWEKIFVGSLAAIVVLAVASLLQIYFQAKPPSLEEVLLMWLTRLPVAGALIWLALHASHEAALGKRLEEDYGYKSAIASTFLGFHKQMSEVGSVAASNPPLGKLCEDTLATIASPPGRIYDKHQLTVSPARELTVAAQAVGDAVNKTALKTPH